MPDLIETVRIDAKHSFEDVIVPVEEFKRRWGTRVAVLGGVDVDLLSRGTEEDIRRRTGQILAACAPGGGAGRSSSLLPPPRSPPGPRGTPFGTGGSCRWTPTAATTSSLATTPPRPAAASWPRSMLAGRVLMRRHAAA